MEHLPDGADPAETVADTLSTPQLQQVLYFALHSLGLIYQRALLVIVWAKVWCHLEPKV